MSWGRSRPEQPPPLTPPPILGEGNRLPSDLLSPKVGEGAGGGGRVHFRRPRFLLAIVVTALVLLPGCEIQQVLTRSLPETAGPISIASTVTQPFYSPSDGLDGLSIGIARDETTTIDETGRLKTGATAEIQYAPETDPRFPEPGFHDWPSGQTWLGELTGQQVIGQSFTALYPNLDGITLRAANFGADISPGKAVLAKGPPVPVLALPIDGKPVTTLPGGSSVRIEGSAEGWANVQLDDGQTGFIDLSRFAELPPPTRINDRDVIFTLYREPEMTEVAKVVVNARDIHDLSHVTFRFPPISGSATSRYRFTLTSPDSTPGNAVTFWYAPANVYADGTRYEGDQAAGGDLVFKPSYKPGAPLYQGAIDTFAASGQTDAMDVRFPPVADTADRYLKLVVRTGQQPVSTYWSRLRPPGGLPLVVEGDATVPPGGLVFNVGYSSDFPLATLGGQTISGALYAARQDPGFFALYLVAVLAVLGWWGRSLIRRGAHGR